MIFKSLKKFLDKNIECEICTIINLVLGSSEVQYSAVLQVAGGRLGSYLRLAIRFHRLQIHQHCQTKRGTRLVQVDFRQHYHRRSRQR